MLTLANVPNLQDSDTILCVYVWWMLLDIDRRNVNT